jgi:hypothetical protein
MNPGTIARQQDAATMTRSLSVQELAHIYVLDSLKGFGPQKFKQLYVSKVSPTEVFENPNRFPDFGKKGETLKMQFQLERDELLKTATARAQKQIEVARKLNALIVTYSHPLYPTIVFESNLPIRGRRKPQWQIRLLDCRHYRGLARPSFDGYGAGN